MNFIFYTTVFAFILLFGSIDINIDYDFWARLIVGKSFFQTGSLFSNDFYSFGKTHEFIDHEWGSSLVFYLIQNHFGDIGLYIFKTLIIFLTLYLITKTIKLKNHDVKLHFLMFFFALHAICYNIFSTIRCQTFSFLFFVFYIYVFQYARTKNNFKILWVIPALNIIWLNMHGGFVLGFAITLLYSIGEYLNKKSAKPYLITLFFLCITSFINPYGIKYLLYIFDAFLLNRVHIPEWQGTFFNMQYAPYLLKFKVFFFIFIISCLFYLYNKIKNTGAKNFYFQIDKTKYLLLIFTTILAIKSLRCNTFFVYTVLIFCYEDFNNFLTKKINDRYMKFVDTVFFILIFISCLSHLYSYKFTNKVNPDFYPVNSVEFIKINNIKGNVFTNFHTGSYVAYKLFPNNFIYMDGRYEEVYDNSLINNMAKFFLAEDYKVFLNHYHFDILIMDKTYPKIIELLKNDNEWFLAYEEKAFALFLPSKYKNIKYIFPSKDEKQFNSEKFETAIDWRKY